MTTSESNKAFADLVKRELYGEVTQEEAEYLWSSADIIAKWASSLSTRLHQTQTQLTLLKNELRVKQKQYTLPQAEREAFEEEQIKKINRTTISLGLIQERLSRIKLWRTAHSASSSSQESNKEVTRTLVQTHRQGYCEGWFDAIDHFYAYTGKGLTPKQAYTICRAHHEGRLQTWKKSTDILAEKPRLPYAVGAAFQNTAPHYNAVTLP